MMKVVGDIPRTTANRDDCLIGGVDWKGHNETLEKVLKKVESHGLTLNGKKCTFGEREIEFYGVTLNENGIKPSSSKVEALHKCTVPTSKEGVKSFIQMVGYMSRFIPNFAVTAAPLRDLTKKNAPFVWGDEENHAFESLKKSLSEHTSLSYFRIGNPIKVYVDGVLVGATTLELKDAFLGL